MRQRRVERIIMLGTLLLFLGVIADQSMCFSCPFELPSYSRIAPAASAESDVTCVLCMSRLTSPVESVSFRLTESWSNPAPTEQLCERLEVALIDHPPRG